MPGSPLGAPVVRLRSLPLQRPNFDSAKLTDGAFGLPLTEILAAGEHTPSLEDNPTTESLELSLQFAITVSSTQHK